MRRTWLPLPTSIRMAKARCFATSLRAPSLRRPFLGLAISRPALLRGFPNRLQPGRRQLALLGLRRLNRLRLLLFQRRPSRSLCGGDPGATRLAHRAALLRSRVLRFGCRGYRGFWPARTALPELRFDVGYLRRDRFESALIPDDGHLQQGVVFGLCVSWHIGVLPRTVNCNCVLISLVSI